MRNFEGVRAAVAAAHASLAELLPALATAKLRAINLGCGAATLGSAMRAVRDSYLRVQLQAYSRLSAAVCLRTCADEPSDCSELNAVLSSPCGASCSDDAIRDWRQQLGCKEAEEVCSRLAHSHCSTLAEQRLELVV
jgi:hypothetical protein